MDKQVLIDKLIKLNEQALEEIEELKDRLEASSFEKGSMAEDISELKKQLEDTEEELTDRGREVEELEQDIEELQEAIYKVTGINTCYSPIEALERAKEVA